MAGDAYSNSCCDGSGTSPTDTVILYQQARLISSGALVNVWIPVADLPAIPPDYHFYNPVDGLCYKLISTDTPTATPGTNILSGWQDASDSGVYTNLCTPSYLQARDCDDNLIDAWKLVGSVTLPYTFKTSGGVCGLIDSTSPMNHSSGTLLTGETTTSGCSDPTCILSTFNYSTGRLSELGFSGGTSDQYISHTLTIDVTGKTNITFNAGDVDDLALMIGVSETVVLLRDSHHNLTVNAPADSWVITPTNGSFSMGATTGTPATGSVINLGTLQARIGAANPTFTGLGFATIAAIFTAVPFPLITLGSPIALSNFASWITSNILSFKLVLVPYGTGDITIPSVTLT